ncbi:MAG TPA: chemotaxis protein CheA [Polyangiaceae bacterium]|nr:chemotaxis protein CheA [Polyangiaceae bacterium]
MSDPEIDLRLFQSSYFDEADEHLSTMEAALLELESNPSDAELLNTIFRAAHSIKGGSGMFNLRQIQQLTHALESLLDPLRAGALAITPAIANLLFRSTDLLKTLLQNAKAGSSETVDTSATLAELEKAYRAPRTPPAGGSPNVASPPQCPMKAQEPSSALQASAPHSQRFEVHFAPGAQLFESGVDPVLVVRNLCRLGENAEVRLRSESLPPLSRLNPEACYLSWDIRLESQCCEAELRDVFAFVEDASTIEIRALPETERAQDLGIPAAAAPPPVDEPGSPPPQQVPPPQVPAPQAAAEVDTHPREKLHEAAAATQSTLRVSTDKLDRLLNLVGEIVIAQSMIVQALDHPAADTLERVRDAVVDMERNTRELQERVMSVRLVPMASVFNRFPRLVRDLGLQCHKQVELRILGQETEIDKGIIEKLIDPLTHLIRNAIDHGIESPEARRAAGKDETGTLTLCASHQGSSVVIEVRDDGRGLDTQRLRERGESLGLIQPGDSLSDDQIHALIFEPGFSTAERVSDISGRGVGLDVVRRNLDSANGSVVVTTERGKGTRILLKLPLTMAILDGLSLRVGEQTFILPLLSITESFRPTRDQLGSIFGRSEVVRVRGEPIPLLRLYEALQVVPEKTDPLRATVVIVESGSDKVGVLVDELLGQAQFVIKSLEANFRKVECAMGATILGDGRVALILDVDSLIRRGMGSTHTALSA